MPVSGAVATSGADNFLKIRKQELIKAFSVGWDINFYIHAAILGGLTILWALYFRDSPSGHPFVARKEYQKITFGKPPKSEKLVNPVRRIFKSLVIWAVWIAVIGNFLVSQFTISYSPLYLSYTLGFPITTAGVLTIAPMGGLLAVKMFTGLASDKLTCIPEVAKIRIFNTVALLGSGMFFILLTMICPTGNAGDVILISEF
ncbi:unnamed protein product [Cylicostephanus goldi]|uniref:Major facilitator superfamily (MFS) profile domain-containing protein n=1 Tax=Cylicostephanus goldi TaxID=71465 RepID=A0A3P6SQU7_CYLGO|nr:unnamed protein product [Cylicostephanus goldi]